MIRISVDTENEISIVRRVLKSEACSHSSNCARTITEENFKCADCIEEYVKGKVELYKREMVEESVPIVV